MQPLGIELRGVCYVTAEDRRSTADRTGNTEKWKAYQRTANKLWICGISSVPIARRRRCRPWTNREAQERDASRILGLMAEEIWDTIIVGAGPAGCAAAYDLASVGRRVLLLDKTAFPRPKACAGGLTSKAVRALRYPIDPVVRRWVRSIHLEEPDPGKEAALSVGRSTPVCAMTIREELDSFCLAQTIARGARFCHVPAIEALEQSGNRVTLRLQSRPQQLPLDHSACGSPGVDGLGSRLEARFVIGADGVHSRIRFLAGEAPWFRRGFALETNVPYVHGQEQYPLTFDFRPVAGGYGWLFPRDNHVNVGLYVERAGTGGALDRSALDQYIVERCGAGRAYTRPAGQFLGLGAAGYRPQPGTRVLLAGDAAGFVDPLTGEGIYGAILSGQIAAAAVHSALSGSLPGSAAGAALLPAARRQKPLPAGMPLAKGYSVAARALQEDLRIAEHAASRFYPEPSRGFRLMRLPLVARAVLKVYSDGWSLAGLLRGVRAAARLAKLLRGWAVAP